MYSVGSVNFKSKIWPDIVKRIGIAFNLSEDEELSFSKIKTAMLIAAIPYFARCVNPLRTACVHLAVYQLARKGCKDIFRHNLDDNCCLLKRLKFIHNYEGGNPLIIRRGMNLLALNMLSGYKRDIFTDPVFGKYNPLTDGVWDYNRIKSALITEIDLVPCREMDDIMTVHESKACWWDGH